MNDGKAIKKPRFWEIPMKIRIMQTTKGRVHYFIPGTRSGVKTFLLDSNSGGIPIPPSFGVKMPLESNLLEMKNELLCTYTHHPSQPSQGNNTKLGTRLTKHIPWIGQ